MTPLASLWLPIRAAAIGVFIASSVVHMAAPRHQNDFRPMPRRRRGFALGLPQQTIWYNRSWVTTLKSTIDGLVDGAVIAGAFAWLWPR